MPLYQITPRISNVEMFTHLPNRVVRQHYKNQDLLTLPHVRPTCNNFPAPRGDLLTCFHQFKSFDNGGLQPPLVNRRTSARFNRLIHPLSSVLQTLEFLKRLKENFRPNAKVGSRGKTPISSTEGQLAELKWGILGTPAPPLWILSEDTLFQLNSPLKLRASARTMIDQVQCIEGRAGSRWQLGILPSWTRLWNVSCRSSFYSPDRSTLF